MKPEDYGPPSGVENTQTFEIEVTKLVNSLKSRIEVRKKIEFDQLLLTIKLKINIHTSKCYFRKEID